LFYDRISIHHFFMAVLRYFKYIFLHLNKVSTFNIPAFLTFTE
jgi:hypothetical protein